MDRAVLTALVTAAMLAGGLLAGAAFAQSPEASPSPAPSPERTAASPASGPEVTIDPHAIGKPPVEELGAPNPALKDQKTKASYAFGFKFGGELARVIQQLNMEIDIDTLVMGIKDVVGEKKPSLSVKDMEEAVKAHVTESRRAIGDKNKKEGDTFLAENKGKKGITTLPSGLQYEVVKEGTGKKPAATDTVSTHYRGTLINGSEFDSSYKRGEPTTFPVNGVIPGWSEALQKMTVGSKWKIFIPSDLAYGAQGAPPRIGPNSTLIFEVELVEIKDAAKTGGDAHGPGDGHGHGPGDGHGHGPDDGHGHGAAGSGSSSSPSPGTQTPDASPAASPSPADGK